MAQHHGILVAALAAVTLAGSSTLTAAAAEAQIPADAATMTQERTVEGGWILSGGKQYYEYADGTKAVGETVIAGVPYLFGYSGALKTDWQTVSGRRYYYDPATGEQLCGWISYFGELYYVTPEDGKITGFFTIEDKQYAFSEDGALLRGEFYDSGIRYFSDPETGELRQGCYSSGSDLLVTDENGVVSTGWYALEDGRRFYLDPETGEAVYGLAAIEGSVYYITPEEGAVRGVTVIGGVPCFFNEETGARREGWFDFEDARYYFDPETQSTLCGCFAVIGEETFYFQENGSMAVGLTEIGNALYYFDENGSMQTGDVTLEDGRYLFGENGAAVTGWLETGDETRFYSLNGVMATGWNCIDIDTYYFDENGILQTGFLELDDQIYYLDETGRRVTGWYELEGERYYFMGDGVMAVSTTVRIGQMGYTFDENGILIEETELPDTLDVVDYKQADPVWGKEKLGTYSTIAKAGCLVTSMAMIHTYHTGETITPVDMRNMLKFTSGGALASWALLENLGYTVETYSGGKPSADVLRHIHELLQAGRPVVLGSKKSSGGQHYVVITGYVGDGVTYTASDFTINDPGYSRRFLLSDHLAEYGSLYKLVY